MALQAYVAEQLFDGATLSAPAGGMALVTKGAIIADIGPAERLGKGVHVTDLGPGTLCPGFVDLQVNGGGGVMLNDAPTPDTVRTIAAAHAHLGTTTLMPTLITDTPQVTHAAVAAVQAAIGAGVPGVAGLHLEGPHLSQARKGAHDPALIRPMTDADLAFLVDAARRLPRLIVTLAPESTTHAQIAALAAAGAIVSLGHSDTTSDTAAKAFAAGAGMVTHLFNAMSQLGNREPGLVGAALSGAVWAGLIADGIHVHPQTIGTALAAKRGRDSAVGGGVFLVTDAMAVAGTTLQGFTLNGRQIARSNGRLTLADGTLAGADVDFATALRVLTRDVGIPLAQALSMATAAPSRAIRADDRCGHLAAGRRADFVHLSSDLMLHGVWQGGTPV
jgi:N-acetylglucosamine-6-phosphate deacetylase